jgi:membrane protein implicated in regulation of membrane protease activity
MLDLYTLCAIAGGTLFVAQLALMLCGIGGDHDADAGADHDISHDTDHDQGHGFGLHGMVSFRALVVGLTFFGLAGRVAASSELSALAVFLIAGGTGVVGLLLMALLMKGLWKLEDDGTAHIEQALGEEAVVYLTIPGKKSGQGKVTVKVQNRLMEYRAVTDYDAIPTGATVEVVDLEDGETLKVALLSSGTAAPAVRTGEGASATPTQEADPSLRKQATPAQKAEGGTHV